MGRSGKNAGNYPKCRISRTIAGRLTPMVTGSFFAGDSGFIVPGDEATV